jgi:hypothetical protein
MENKMHFPGKGQLLAEGSWLLLYVNACSKHGFVETSHTRYSPDLTTAAFLPLATVTTALKGKTFRDVEDIKKSLTAKLNDVPLEPNDDFKNFLKYAINVFK